MTKLQEYWRDLPSHKKQALADRVDMKKGSLSNVFNGTVNPSLDLIKRLMNESKGKIRLTWFLENKK